MSEFSAVDASPDPARLLESLDRSAIGLGAMKRYVAYRLALLTSGGSVLDVGCGAGHDLELLDNEGCRPFGLDPSWIMLEQSRRRDVPLACATGEALPFRSGAFDACRIERVLMHAHDPERVLDEIARVVRPGGFVALFEPDWTTLQIDSAVPGAEDVPRWLTRCRWPDVGGRLAALAEVAGFEIVDEVREASRCGRLAFVPLNVEPLLARAVEGGRVDSLTASAWLAEQRSRDVDGSFRARWTKQLVIGWRPE